MSPRKGFAQSLPRTHISTVAKIIEPPMKGPVGGNVTFHPRQGPFASSWALCAREWLFVRG